MWLYYLLSSSEKELISQESFHGCVCICLSVCLCPCHDACGGQSYYMRRSEWVSFRDLHIFEIGAPYVPQAGIKLKILLLPMSELYQHHGVRLHGSLGSCDGSVVVVFRFLTTSPLPHTPFFLSVALERKRFRVCSWGNYCAAELQAYSRFQLELFLA